jgi:hypothetical protein
MTERWGTVLCLECTSLMMMMVVVVVVVVVV